MMADNGDSVVDDDVMTMTITKTKLIPPSYFIIIRDRHHHHHMCPREHRESSLSS